MLSIGFRADSSLTIGTGHHMRCLSLALSLRNLGHSIFFISRCLNASIILTIEQYGFKVYRLPSAPAENHTLNSVEDSLRTTDYSSWLGVDQFTDSSETISILASVRTDVLVVDHYALDSLWEKRIRSYVHQLVVIDDLANRVHDCDILIDQTFNRRADDYRHLLPSYTNILVGTRYTLLRSDFCRSRQTSIKRRYRASVSSLLIALGGQDPDNLTSDILCSLSKSPIAKSMSITIVMGKYAPHIESVKALADTLRLRVNVLVDIRNMSTIMHQADIAIGASGSMTWERCCLALPSIQLVIAENQRYIADNLSKKGISISLDASEISKIPHYLELAKKKWIKQSFLSSIIVDGDGVSRIIKTLTHPYSDTTHHIDLIPIDENDSNTLFKLQHISNIRHYCRSPELPSVEEHRRWFNHILYSPNHVVLLIYVKSNVAGVLRIEGDLENDVEISILIDPNFSGRSIASQSIRYVINLLPNRIIRADIHRDNQRSHRLFSSIGFTCTNDTDIFWKYIYDE